MPRRVLLIDDDRFARQVYGDALRGAGYAVETAEDGEHGLEALARGQKAGQAFDVVVLDMLLPGMDGLTVLAEVRRIDPDVGVVVITALDRVDSAVRAIKAGAYDYLLKPVNSETLSIAVERAIELRSLLRENEGLKAHLALMEAGARLTSDLDRERVARRLVDALLAHTGAERVLVLGREDGRLVTLADGGEGPPAEALRPSPEALGRLAAAEGVEPVPLDAGGALGAAIPPGAAEATVLLFSNAPFGEEDRLRAAFLLRHAAQALETAGHLESARELAFEDDLTGLYNARYLDSALDELLERSHSLGAPFSVLFLDLDHFKIINDRYGHLAGSELLKEVAVLLRQSIREDDRAIRYGGDEYVVLLPETPAEMALQVAERIRSRIAAHGFSLGGEESAHITVSIGVASYPLHAVEKTALLDLADRALYRGKRAHRNVVYLADPTGEEG